MDPSATSYPLVHVPIGRHKYTYEVAQVQLTNDLQTAVEVNSLEGRQILYPEMMCPFERPLEVAVCLRDDRNIHGTCNELSGLCFTSSAFGDFGREAQHFLQKEAMLIQREHRLQKERQQHLYKKFRWKYLMDCSLNWCIWVICLSLLVVCILVQPESFDAAVLLGLGAGCLCCCSLQISTLWSIYMTVRARGASRRFDQETVNRFWDYLNKPIVYVWFSCMCVLLPVLALITGIYVSRGFPSAAGLLWVPVVLGVGCWVGSAIAEAMGCCSLYGEFVQRIAGRDSGEIHAQGGYDFAQHTIVFEGSIIPDKPCVCSWPGKYESAWDALVRASRGHTVSAAVVFLPKGSKDFGIHDSIPATEELQGDCWCTPLYGQKKPWGCRWWSRWITNIEEAVEKGGELQVYFFKGMKGKGKVENFATAGKEHLRREEIYGRKWIFEQSEEFETALRKGLDGLSKEQRGDSSSQYSREVHRLFLSWLEEEDREFLSSSEGLGNSQKAEVAWLERKGYAYTDVEVDVSEWVQDH